MKLKTFKKFEQTKTDVFEAAAYDHHLSGKRPTKEKISDSVWSKIRKLIDTGYAKSYEIKPTGWRTSKALLALDDITGVFSSSGGEDKELIITMNDDSVVEVKLFEKEATKNKWDKSGKMTTITFFQFDADEEGYNVLRKLYDEALKYAQNLKKSKKTVTGKDGVEYGEKDFVNVLKRDCPSFVELLHNGYVDSQSSRQIKNGTIVISTPRTSPGWDNKMVRELYVISKSGKLYDATSNQGATLLTQPALQNVEGYEKCFKFIIDREEREKAKELRKKSR